MDSTTAAKTYIYTINKDNRITSVSDNWLLFARENQAAASCYPEMVIGKLIWDFIDGMETTHLYEVILNNVRAKSRAITLPFRCDAPDKRRYLELVITPLRQGRMKFASYIIREEPRDRVALLESGMPRTADIVNMCSSCKKIQLSAGWVEVEAAVVSLNLFDADELPQISHGLCPVCFEAAMAGIEKLHS